MASGWMTEVGRLSASRLAMEPELRNLESIIAILRVLGEADDAVDPACLSLLAIVAATP